MISLHVIELSLVAFLIIAALVADSKLSEIRAMLEDMKKNKDSL